MRKPRAYTFTPLETAEENSTQALFLALGAKVYKLSMREKTKQTPGLPDLLSFCPSATDPRGVVMVWVESKREVDYKVRPEQRIFQMLCKLSGIDHVLGGHAEVMHWARQRGLMVGNEVQPHPRLDDQLAKFGGMFEEVAHALWATKAVPLVKRGTMMITS